MKRRIRKNVYLRAVGVGVVVALCLKISLASFAVAQPRTAATGDPDKDIFAALAQICTSQGGTFLQKDGGDGNGKHPGGANECPLCSAFLHAALPSAAVEIPQAPAAEVALASVMSERFASTHASNVRPRAPPHTVSA